MFLEFETLHNKIIPEQFGFRAEHSTTQQILRITERASINFNINRSTGLVMLDLAKAFDSVWHDGLVFKLIKMGIPHTLVNIIDSYLKDRKSYVEVDKSTSSSYNVEAGVPQGSILSPHLFNIFINDVPTPKDCQLSVYADDTALFCNVPWKNARKVKNILVSALEKVSKFFKAWKIKVNSAKTEFIVFTHSRVMNKRLADNPPIFEGVTFKWQPFVTYLGVDLDQKLNFGQHISKVISKARKMVSVNYSLLKKKSAVSKHAKISIYRSIIRPILTYACPIYSNCPKKFFSKLQIQQN